LAKQKITYEQVLDKLSVPVDIDKVKVCKFCGELMHLIKVNKLVAFWVHKGEDVEKCARKNTFEKGHPMIAQNMMFYKQMTEIWQGIIDQKEKVNKNGGNSKD